MNLLNNLKLQTRLLGLFSILILLATAAIGWMLYTIAEQTTRINDLSQQSQELADVYAVQNALVRQHKAIADYVAYGDTLALTEFAQTAITADETLEQAQINAQDGETRELLTNINNELSEYNRAFASGIVMATDDDINAQDEIAAAATDQQERVDRLVDQIDNFTYRRRLELADAAQQGQDALKRSVGVGVVLLLIFCLLAVLASLVTNGIAEPILHLTNAVVAFENDAYRPQLLEEYIDRADEPGKLALAVDSMARSITESTQARERFLEAASRFVPYAYLDFLQKPSLTDVRLGDHISAEMAVMFSDIRSFSTISEHMTAAENFDFINDYLRRISPSIQQNNGLIVKFLGDGMMALFPFGVDDAVRAGIAKLDTVALYNHERAQRGLPAVDLGIGIHTGHMMFGMIGEEGRMQGDAFSDNVNLTSRIEGLNKYFGTNFIISQETRSRLENPEAFRMRQLGKVQVKGRNTPITLYEVLDGDFNQTDELKLETKATFEEALRLYTLGKFSEALPLFEEVTRHNPHDVTAANYLEDVTELKQAGVPDVWDGVIVMKSK